MRSHTLLLDQISLPLHTRHLYQDETYDVQGHQPDFALSGNSDQTFPELAVPSSIVRGARPIKGHIH